MLKNHIKPPQYYSYQKWIHQRSLLARSSFHKCTGISSTSELGILLVLAFVVGAGVFLSTGFLKSNKDQGNQTQPSQISNFTNPRSLNIEPKTPKNDTNYQPDQPVYNDAELRRQELRSFNNTSPSLSYQLVIEKPQGLGSSSPEEGNYSFLTGSRIQVRSNSSSGWRFDHWIIDGQISDTDPIILIMNSPHQLSLVFTKIQYNLTIDVKDSGITDPPPGSYVFDNGTDVSVNAKASDGWEFHHWVLEEENSTVNPITLKMIQNHRLEAVFTRLSATLPFPSTPSNPPQPPHPIYKLMIQTPTGSGSTNPVTGNQTYNQGSAVQVAATPSSGWKLSYWQLDGVDAGSENPITVIMNMAHTIEAVFTQIMYTLTVSTVGQGTVSENSNQASYASGSTVQMTTTPSAGWSFSGWSGDLSGSTNPTTITINGDKTVTVSFTPIQYTVTVNTSGQGSVAKSPNQASYTYGSTIQLTATPATGYTFTGWSGDLSGSTNPTSITMNDNRTVLAIFMQAPVFSGICIHPWDLQTPFFNETKYFRGY